jgi:hypothetical protein
VSAEYLINLPDGRVDGPYTEEDLLDMVDADEIGAGTICEDMATRRRCRIRDLFRIIPPAPDPAVASEEPEDAAAADEPGGGPDLSPRPAPPNRWVPAPLPESAPVAAVPAPQPVRLIYAGHPSLLMYWRSVVGSLGLMAGAWYAGRWENGGWWLAAGWLSGGLWLALTLLRRSSVEYRVTTRRVEVQRGLISKSSQEIRIPDIRAINVRKTGFSGLLGVGDLSFSSASGGAEDVNFPQASGAHRIKNQVRRLQDRGA